MKFWLATDFLEENHEKNPVVVSICCRYMLYLEKLAMENGNPTAVHFKLRKYESIFMVFFLVQSPDNFEDHFKIAWKCHKNTQARLSSTKTPIAILCSRGRWCTQSLG